MQHQSKQLSYSQHIGYSMSIYTNDAGVNVELYFLFEALRSKSKSNG